MADLGNRPKQIGDFEGVDELITFSLEPMETLPTLQTAGEDTTLYVPAIDIPEKAPVLTEETLEVEHELTKMERRELLDAVKQFTFTSTQQLGRTNLIEHEIILKDGAKPRKQPTYRCSLTIRKEIDAEIERWKQMNVIEECYSE